MKVKIQDGVLVIEAESEIETDSLKEWRKRKRTLNKEKWLEVRYFNSIKAIVI